MYQTEEGIQHAWIVCDLSRDEYVPLPLATDVENWAESVDGLIDLRKSLTRVGERQHISQHFMLWLVMPKRRNSQLEQISKVPISQIGANLSACWLQRGQNSNHRGKGVLNTLKRNYQTVNIVDWTQNWIEENISLNQVPSLSGQNTGEIFWVWARILYIVWWAYYQLVLIN